jgi:methyltransferase (TIGR00027 family)
MQIISRTAAYVAAGRAVGAREPDPDVRNPDYLAERFLGEDTDRFDLDLPVMHALSLSYAEAMEDIEVASTVRAMAVRTRFIDDVLERSVDSGATQLLILGAGLDSHAYRCQELLHNVKVFEVDRPVTQVFKRQRVDEVLGGPPGNLTYVPIDFQTESLRDVLASHGYDCTQRSCVIMEGLTMYLSEDALRQTMALIASHPPRTSVVFDFVADVLVSMLKQIDIANMPEFARPFVTRFLHLIRDEPWEFGFPLGKEADYLEALGFEVREILSIGSREAARRYLTKADGTELAGDTMSRVPQPPGQTEQQRDGMTYRIAEAVVALKH